MLWRALIAAAIAALGPAGAAAQNVHLPSIVTPFEPPSARAAAFGGFHPAYASDADALFSNPALFRSVDAQFSLADIALELLDFGMIGVVLDYLADIGVDNSLAILKEGVKNSLTLGGPLALGFVKDGWGAGLFNVTRLDLAWTEEAVWRARLSVTGEFFITGGRAFRLADAGGLTLDAGIALKLFWRGGHLMSVWLQELKYFLENTRNDIFERQYGGGIDAGLALRLPRVTLGLAVRDPWSPVAVTQYRNWQDYKDDAELAGGFARVRPRLAAGLAARPEAPVWRHIVTRLVFTLDWGQVLFFMDEEPRSPLLDLAAGFEVCLADKYSFRMALSEMLPAAGFGIRFGLLAVDLAARMRETGASVWQHPTFSLSLNVLYRYDWPF